MENAKIKLFGQTTGREASPGEKLLGYLSKGVATKHVIYESFTTNFKFKNFKLAKNINKFGLVGDALTVGNELLEGNYDKATLELIKAAGGTYTTAFELTKFVAESQLPAVTKGQADLAMKYYRMGVSAKSESLKRRYFKMAQNFQKQALKMQSHLKKK